MKKNFFFIILGCLSLCALCGCGSPKKTEANRKLQLTKESYEEQEQVWMQGEQEKNPKVTANNIRQLKVVLGGKTIYQIAYCPKEGRQSYLSWRMLSPYSDTATIDTEKMTDFYKKIEKLKLVKTDSVKDAGTENPKAVISVAYSKNSKDAKASNTAILLVGKAKDSKSYYCCYMGREKEIFLVNRQQMDAILNMKAQDLILKIPYLVDITKVSKVVIDCQGKETVMKSSDGHYYFRGKEVDEKEYHNNFAKLMLLNIEGDSCITATKFDFTVLHIQFYGIKPEDDCDVKIMKDSANRKYIEINNEPTFYLKGDEVDLLTKIFHS